MFDPIENDQIRRMVEDQGWAINLSKGVPYSAHTIGLTNKNHPELYIQGLIPDQMLKALGMLSWLVTKKGIELKENQMIVGVLDDYDLMPFQMPSHPGAFPLAESIAGTEISFLGMVHSPTISTPEEYAKQATEGSDENIEE